MNEREATEYFLQLYPKCGLKTVAVFGLDITPFLKFGFRDVVYQPTGGDFDAIVMLFNEPLDIKNQWGAIVIRCQIAMDNIKIGGIAITDGEMLLPQFIQIHSGILNAYKRKA